MPFSRSVGAARNGVGDSAPRGLKLREGTNVTPKEVLALCREKDVKAVDLRFMDFPGLWQHFTIPVGKLTEDVFEDGIGFDVLREDYVDMMKEGIIDPAKVTKSAVQNAVSVGGLLLTTGAVVAQIEEEKPAAPAAPPPEMY